MSQSVSPRPHACDQVPREEGGVEVRFGTSYRHLSRVSLGPDYRVGVVLKTLAPGRQSTPAHYHIFEEEHVSVPEGGLSVRVGSSAFQIHAGDYICFRAARPLGHCLINDGGTPCRYVIVGPNDPNQVAVYTDSQKVLVRSLGDAQSLIFDVPKEYWHG
jgi:uncharacterized cupin superfamily protein